MKKELTLLNLICVLVALGFVAVAVINVLTSGEWLSTDNLFVTMVCLVMALMFIANPLLYLKSEGKLPVPFLKSASPAPQLASGSTQQRFSPAASTPPLLDKKGRAVPPDVKAIMSNMGQTEVKDA